MKKWIALSLVAMMGCASGTYDAYQAAEDAKLLVSVASNEAAFRLRADGKDQLAAEVEIAAGTVKGLIDSLVSGEETSIGVLRKALLEVETQVIAAIQNEPPEKKDLLLHQVNQVHNIVHYFIDRYERAQAADVGGV